MGFGVFFIVSIIGFGLVLATPEMRWRHEKKISGEKTFKRLPDWWKIQSFGNISTMYEVDFGAQRFTRSDIVNFSRTVWNLPTYLGLSTK